MSDADKLAKLARDTGTDINRALSGAGVIPEEGQNEILNEMEDDLRDLTKRLYIRYLTAQKRYAAFLRLRNDGVPMTNVTEPVKGE